MPEEFRISANYTCSSVEVYNTLKAANLSDQSLAKMDTVKDNVITEDELVQFCGSSDKKVSGGNEMDSHQQEYRKNMRLMLQYQKELSELMYEKSFAKSHGVTTKGDPFTPEKETELQGKIDTLNDKILGVQGTLDDLRGKINGLAAQGMTTTKKTSKNNNGNAASGSGTLETTSSDGSSKPWYVDGKLVGNLTTVKTSKTSFDVIKGSGKDLLKYSGNLGICLKRIGESLGTTAENAADYIATLCKTVGGGSIPPAVILSQIFSESSGIQSCTTTQTSKYVGFGQIGASAVQAVNKAYGTNFTFEDMNDGVKNLEVMVRLMKYHYDKYGDIGAAITGYATGHYSGVVIPYAKKVLSRI